MSGQPLALVTGAASGIGRATSLRLARDGHRVCGIDLDVNGLDATRTRCSAGSFSGYELDLADVAAIEQTLADILDVEGPVDVLVNNAGIGIRADAPSTTVCDWDRTIAVDLSATFHTCRLLLPSMIERGRGVVVNVSSVAAIVGVADRAAYCSAKAGVLGLTRAIAVDHASQGIRANAICPGTVETEWIDKILTDAPNADELRTAMAARQLDNRMGSPEEVAAGIAFLASPEARFVNGSSFIMDGGMSVI